MSLRTILITIGVLIFIAILIDGYRHWRRAKQHDKEMDRQTQRHLQDVEPQFGKKYDRNDDFAFEPKIRINEAQAQTQTQAQTQVQDQDDDQDHFISDVRVINKTTQTTPAATARFSEPLFTTPTPKPAPTSKPAAAKSAPVKMPEPLPKKEKFIILHVLAEPDTYFSGEALVTKFANHHLYFGPMDIYHYYENDSYGDILFSVANAFEPGTLIMDYPQGFYTQGLTFFIQLPGQGDPEEAFEAMLNTATVLAKTLNARICDHQRQPLTPARVEQYRHEVTACNVI